MKLRGSVCLYLLNSRIYQKFKRGIWQNFSPPSNTALTGQVNESNQEVVHNGFSLIGPLVILQLAFRAHVPRRFRPQNFLNLVIFARQCITPSVFFSKLVESHFLLVPIALYVSTLRLLCLEFGTLARSITRKSML